MTWSAPPSRAFLGLTVACARCHDHKFDPISQMDYYRMTAIFNPFIDHDYPLAPPAEAAAYAAKKSEIDAKIQALTREVRRIEDPYIEAAFQKKLETFPEDVRTAVRTPEDTADAGAAVARGADAVDPQHQRAPDHAERRRPRGARETAAGYRGAAVAASGAACRWRRASATAITGSRRTVRAMSRWRAPRPTASRWISKAASCRSPESRTRRRLSTFPAMAEPGKGKLVEPGFLSVLTGGGPAAIKPLPADRLSSGRRRALAEWIVSPDNPLTARVMVNRIWHHHFGRGIVTHAEQLRTHGRTAVATRSCSIGWPRSLSARAGASRRCIG